MEESGLWRLLMRSGVPTGLVVEREALQAEEYLRVEFL